jgi:hypothetical protein
VCELLLILLGLGNWGCCHRGKSLTEFIVEHAKACFLFYLYLPNGWELTWGFHVEKAFTFHLGSCGGLLTAVGAISN